MNPKLDTVVKSIQNWNAIKNDKNKLLYYLKEGDHFSLSHIDIGTSLDIHAYCGILNDKLVFFLIPSEFDNKSQMPDTIVEYITTCPIHPRNDNDVPHEIPEKEAKKRMLNWKKDLTEWVPKQINTTDGIFQAFAIPSDDINNFGEPIANFALKDSSNPTGYTADLVIIDTTEKGNIYYDTVRPVPPFPPVSDFFLLALAGV